MFRTHGASNADSEGGGAFSARAEDLDAMAESAKEATELLKALAHEGRLMILCHLATGEKSVTELENLLSQRQAAVSQQLSRLRFEGLVENRREGKAILYRLSEPRAARLIAVLYDMFCAEADRGDAGDARENGENGENGDDQGETG